jgi:hypothetical protein
MSISTTNASQRHASPDGPQGEPCPNCTRPMPLRAKRPDEVTTHWECTGCRSPITGVLLKEAVPLLAAHIHLSQKHFDVRGLRPIPDDFRALVREFLNQRCNQAEPQDERRSEVRVPQQLDVTVVPLSENWTPQGKPILGIVVDLSSRGLGMITTAQIQAPYVVTQIQHGTGFVQLLGRIAWSKGFSRGFYSAGVQFVVRLGKDTAG